MKSACSGQLGLPFPRDNNATVREVTSGKKMQLEREGLDDGPEEFSKLAMLSLCYTILGMHTHPCICTGLNSVHTSRVSLRARLLENITTFV